MVARSVADMAAALRDAANLEAEVDDSMWKFAEAVAKEIAQQGEEFNQKMAEILAEMERLKGKGGKQSEQEKKDRKRSEPKEAFNGKNLIDFEWRINNHLETCFGDEGRRMMQSIRERAQAEEKITHFEGQQEFDDWREKDRDLWTQMMRSEGEEVTLSRV